VATVAQVPSVLPLRVILDRTRGVLYAMLGERDQCALRCDVLFPDLLCLAGLVKGYTVSAPGLQWLSAVVVGGIIVLTSTVFTVSICSRVGPRDSDSPSACVLSHHGAMASLSLAHR